MKKICLLLTLALLIDFVSAAQENVKIDADKIDKLVHELQDSLGIPGIAIGIAVKDEVKYTGFFGFASIETGTPMGINSLWRICSISKQFTTAACLRLAEENKLSLNDRITKYIDSLPCEYSAITIHNLLSHTSGIKDYLNQKGLYGIPWEKVKAEIIADTLNFRPGTAWSYSNTGFWFAAGIVGKTAGTSYNKYIKDNFFIPLMMEQTERVPASDLPGQRVTGYSFDSGKLIKSDKDNIEFYGEGDGELISTLPDLLKWNIALTGGRIISRNSLRCLWCRSILDNGRTLEAIPGSGTGYGLGWFIKIMNGYKVVWTPGSGFGFSTSSQYYPDYDLNIIVLCNKEQFLMADEIGFAIANICCPGSILY